MRMLNLCDGYGGFSLALERLGVRTVCRVERDAYAAAVLIARMGERRLPDAPIWDDLNTFDGSAWRGFVEVVSAGFPCQPFSAAGQRKGVDDDRWLWPAIGRIIRDVGPRFVMLENVPQLVRHGLPYVLSDLADLGFDAEWGLYSAADVGAPHRRQRFWLLAVAHEDDPGRESLGWLQPGLGSRGVADGPGSSDVGDTGGEGRPEITGGAPRDEGSDGWWSDRADIADGAVEDVALADGEGLQGGGVRGYEPAKSSEDVADTAGLDEREPHHAERSESRQWTRADVGGCGFPPRPDDTDGWERWIAAGGPEPSLRRSVDESSGRMVRPAYLADRLHLLGNGLVPSCAAEAYRQLYQRLYDRKPIS